MTVVNFRCDAATTELLDSLAEPGESRSDTIRRALRDAAKLRQRDLMRQQAVAVAADADDLAEAASVQDDLRDLRAW